MKQVSKLKYRSTALVLLTALAAGAALPSQAARVLPALERPALTVARPAQCVMLAVVRAGNRLVAAGERGLVMLSDDSGQTWKQARVPVSVTLNALRFRNEREGWAVGNMGVVLHTADGGATWERLLDGRAAAQLALQSAQAAHDAAKPDPNDLEHPLKVALDNARRLVDEGADKPLLDLALAADGALTTVGAYGLAFASQDGGRHWQARMGELPNPEGFTLNGMAVRQQEQFLFGEQGLLLHAAGPGQPFKLEALPSATSLFGAVQLREGPLLLLGLRGKVFRSAAPGAPWVEIQTPVDASLFTGLQLADGTVLLVGAAGQLLSSRDGGQSFAVQPMKTRFPFTGAAVAPDGSVVLAGTRGVLRLPALAASTTPAATDSNRNNKEARDGKL
jgi:photosystem II stability/assembly factor-like uncharacterized protein